MTDTRQYVSATVNGIIPAYEAEVVISFYGPQGGKRGIISLSPEEATRLSNNLTHAVAFIKQAQTQDANHDPAAP